MGSGAQQMFLRGGNCRGTGRSRCWICALCVVLAVFLFVGSVANSPAQAPKSASPLPANSGTAATVVPLGRETPRRMMMGALEYGERGDFKTPARYLQAPPGQESTLVQRAKEVAALRPWFKGDIDLLSDDPKGTICSPGDRRSGRCQRGWRHRIGPESCTGQFRTKDMKPLDRYG